MKKLVLISVLLLLVTGCVQSTRSNVKTFEFPNAGDAVANQEKCVALCLGRQATNDGRGIMGARYTCDYKPVTCNETTCLCETY